MLIVWEARLWIVGVTLIATVVAAIAGAREPKVYSARATILAPKEGERESFAASVGSLLNAASGGSGMSMSSILGGAGNTTTADLFMLLLRTRGLREIVVTSMTAKHGPGVDNAIKDVVNETPDPGSLTLTVEATDPVLAAEFANEYILALDRTLQKQSDQRGERQRTAYGAQLARAAREVTAAEAALLRFQSETRLLGNFEVLGGKEIDMTGGIRSAILNAERRREVLALFTTAEHPDVQELDREIAELKALYSRTLYGAPMDLADGKGGTRREYFVPMAKLAALQMEQMKLVRLLLIQETFYTAALNGVEQVQYNSAKPPVRVVSVDAAIPPGEHVRPDVPIIITAALVSSLVSTILLSIVVDRLYERRMASVAAARGGA